MDVDKEATPSEKLVLEFMEDTALTEVSFTLWNHNFSLTDETAPSQQLRVKHRELNERRPRRLLGTMEDFQTCP